MPTRLYRLGGSVSPAWRPTEALPRLFHLWRRSLWLRVVSSTVVFSTVVLAGVGTYLYQQIADGLVVDRIESAKRDANAETSRAGRQFTTTDRAVTSADLNTFARTLVKGMYREGTSDARFVVFARLPETSRPITLQRIEAGPADMLVPSPELEKALSAESGRQQVQVSTVPGSGGEAVSAVVVAQRITASAAGEYGLYFVYPLYREREVADLVRRWFLLGGALLLVLVGGIAFVVTRLVVTPVRQAAATAELLADGRLSERLPVRGEDDLARLGSSFNTMAGSLQKQIGQLEDLSRVQQRFVSDVSHELRTPLTTIRMAADLIHDARDGFDPTVRRSAELLANQLDRFEFLLTDLLEISRFDAGAAALETDGVDLAALAERVVDGAEPLAQQRGCPVCVTADGDVIAEVDPRRIERILRNLVVNAIEHSEARPVEVTVSGNETAVAVTVRDYGVGLGPGEAELVFNRFWRADPARARTTGGTGLGLSIALEDAKLHGGILDAWGARGQGACFRLVVPRCVQVPMAHPPLAVSPVQDNGS